MAVSSFIPPAVAIGEAENRRNKVALILVISLFFLWGIAYGLLDVLNKHFQERLSITKARSTLLQAAYFGAYFLFALPAGYVIKRWGYKSGIVTGLSLYSIGAIMFFPATEWASFDMFLFALFVLATGLTCLETAANPYVTILGTSKTSAIRLNVAQCFNGVGAFLGPIIGANWFFSSHGSNLTSVKNVYLMISALVISVAVLFIFTKLPESAGKPVFEEKPLTNRPLTSDRNFLGAVIAQFFYVAAQVGIAALFINYCLEARINIDTAQASYLLAISLFLFAVGRIAGTALMNRIAPQVLLSAYGVICLVLSIIVIMNFGVVSVGALMAAFFFESIMFPTIFALGIKNLGTQTKKASSILIMSIVGGAIVPYAMGFLADQYATAVAFLIPACCFLVVTWYGLFGYREPDLSQPVNDQINKMIKQDTIATSFLRIDEQDNVAVALKDLSAGSTIILNGQEIILRSNVPAKHKFLLTPLSSGENVYMYGTVVGKVTSDLAEGDMVSTANTVHAVFEYRYRGYASKWKPPDVRHLQKRTFLGYKRKDGRYGTANHWLFIPMVFCENRNLDTIKTALNTELGYARTDKYNLFTRQLKDAFDKNEKLSSVAPSLGGTVKSSRIFKNIDGIKFLTHTGGCGGTREDADTLGSLLAAYADHPNVAGVTVLSLGCQHLQTSVFLEKLKAKNFSKPLITFEQQDSASEEALIYDAIRQTFNGLIEANRIEREPAPLSELTFAVKCGGSDGFSGISANPSVGHASDILVALGGKVLLAEFPELAGAEQDLIDRSISSDTAEKFIRLMHSYDELAHRLGSGFHMNPSPGNIKDGLITDAMKSCGAAKKGGTSPVVDVLDYTEPAVKPGLNLLCTPGNDVEATTGQVASGATLVLFTTGLGTPTGNPIAPTIKVATNTSMAKRMRDIIDIDTGPVITGNKTIEEMGEEIFEYCIKVASGDEVPRSVQLEQDDFIPWKRGVSL